MQDNAATFAPLAAGDHLGANRIRRPLGTTAVGSFYEVTYASTSAVYGLFVLSADLAADASLVQRTVRRLGEAPHPCLARSYASGCDDGRVWIRSELSTGVPLKAFDLPPAPPENPWPLGEMVVHAGRLRDLFHGTVPQEVAWPILADLTEALAFLHREELLAGPMTTESVVFMPVKHGKGLLAKWAGYGLLEVQNPDLARRWTAQDDVRSAGALFRELLCGEFDRPPLTAWAEWSDFLARADGTAEDGAFSDGGEMLEGYADMLRQRNIRWEPHQPPGAANDGGDETRDAAPAPPAARQHQRRKRIGAQRGRHGDQGDHGSAPLPIGPAFKMLLLFGLIGAIGFAAYWIASYDIRQRERGLRPVEQADRESEAAGRTPAARAPLGTLSREALKERHESGDLAATLRLAFWIAQGDDRTVPDPAEGASLARAALARAADAGIDPRAADAELLFWAGWAWLAGLGVEPDPERGMELLRAAADRHAHPRAMALLGDYFAFATAEPSPLQDVEALTLWRNAVDAHETWNTQAAEIADRAVAFVRQGRGIPRGDAVQALMRWIERLAQRRHVPAMLAMGVLTLEGRLTTLNETQAMDWFRAAAQRGSPEGMRRMAWMFERGIGTPQSDTSAVTWYQRAATAGDAEAMTLLADMLADGRGGADSGDEAVVAEWRRRAGEIRAAAADRPPRHSWWQPEPPARRDPRPDRADPPEPPAPAAPRQPPPSDSALPPVKPELLRPETGELRPLG